MNYLAHAFLSNNEPELLVGNFIADHLRGSDLSLFPDRIRDGIMLHRKIDSFTDSHPAFRASKRLFYDGFEKHSGILVDIYYDHFLARDFDKYHSKDLRAFSEDVYSIYRQYEALLPAGSARFLEYVLKNNIYTAYGSLQGIEKVLFHLSQRIRHDVRLDHSVTLLKLHEKALAANFDLFFEEIRRSFAAGF